MRKNVVFLQINYFRHGVCDSSHKKRLVLAHKIKTYTNKRNLMVSLIQSRSNEEGKNVLCVMLVTQKISRLHKLATAGR
jgi:hypothetical protein